MDRSTQPEIEDPALHLTDVAIALHFVDEGDTCGAEPPDVPSAMQSMEVDLLAYRFQDPPPFNSRIHVAPSGRSQSDAHGGRPIVICYPEEFEYRSESRTPKLRCPQPQRRAEILVSSTHFPNSGICVWHLVITPRPNETFTEFDLIKLMHLYDDRKERTGLEDSIGFQLGDGGVERVTAEGLPDLLELPRCTGPRKLPCGTVELLVGAHDDDGESSGHNAYVSVLNVLRRARDIDDATAGRQLKTWMGNNSREWRIIVAYCGIVEGIFDFSSMDEKEVLDALEPTLSGPSVFTRIQRRTVTCIADDDRSMRESRGSVGISPYLILPHAALLHNEALVDMAERLVDSAVRDSKSKLEKLEEAYIDAERCLNTLFLPNVFNYVTERTLFESGAESRGSNARRIAVLGKLSELKGHVEVVREHEHSRGQVFIQILLAVISALQLYGLIADVSGWKGRELVWLVTGIVVVLAGVVWWFQTRGMRRRIGKPRAGRHTPGVT
jgi:hypothetical protein